LENKKYIKFDKKIIIVGFGSIGKAVLPLLLRHIDIKPEQIVIITKDQSGADEAKEYGVQFIAKPLTKSNYKTVLSNYMHSGDFLLNVSVDVSSKDLIEYCLDTGSLYLDTCIEPWEGGYTDVSLTSSMRTNYAFRESVLALKDPEKNQPTAVVTHGANPGLVSHLVKQALLNIANDTDLDTEVPTTQEEWAKLACALGIKVIHIAERDCQITNKSKVPGEFVNTWSVDGFVSEGCQPAELGWGSHESTLPDDGSHHDFGPKCAIFLNRPGASTKVRTWTPLAGPFHGYLITHAEAISIAHYFTIEEGNTLHYRPTVHYAYHPCDEAVLSLHELQGNEWTQQGKQRLLLNEITDGIDELGVLLMGNPKGAYWYGSQLSIHEARKLAPHNNATSLQVAISILAGMIWAIEHPEHGVTEPEEIDFRYIMNITAPYLGKVTGHYTDWNPLVEREKFFSENIDKTDPWQFINMRVN
jgi:homospermidine synthase